VNVSVDPGFGNERTALAWQRTALSLAGGSAILARLTLDRLGAAALVSVAVAAPLALWVLWESRGRYRHDADIDPRSRSRGGRAPLAITLATLVVGFCALAAQVLA
jgi:uncharacterized membrane protein YidH (DUF202 family)